MEETLAISDFKANCLQLIKRLASHELAKITVTRHGKPVAVVTSPPSREEELRAVAGSMKGMAVPLGDFDLTEPIFDGEMDADLGILHN